MSQTNQPSSETLLTQPVSRLFFQYFRSNLVSSLMLAVYVLFDTIFIGWGVGSQGLAALNITLPCYSLEIGFAQMMGMAEQPPFLSAADRERKRKQTAILRQLCCLPVFFL